MTQQLKHSLKRREAKRKALHAAIHSTNNVMKVKDSDEPVAVSDLGEPTHTLAPGRKKGTRIRFNEF